MVQTSNKLNEAHMQNAYNIQDMKTSELLVKVYSSATRYELPSIFCWKWFHYSS